MGGAASVSSFDSNEVGNAVSKFGEGFETYKDVIAQYGITGQMLNDLHTEYDWNQLFAKLNIDNQLHQKVISEQYALAKQPPIRLIDFEDFKKHGGFPRYPDNKSLVTSLDHIDRENSLIIFLSHCWLRGHPAAEGWDGRPHPDNAYGDKFKLCAKGIEQIANSMAPRMTKCYIWLDFCCIDQDSSACAELKMLKEIVECCDLIFTPIHDSGPEWVLEGYENLYDEYKSKLWNDGPFAYLNRGWCRVEMFYAANIPVVSEASRHSQFAAGLAFHNKFGRRPHFLYGTSEYNVSRPPICLPPLQNSYFDKYNPEKGHLSVASDMVHIEALVEDLKPYMEFAVVGYVGDRNDKGEKHGYGIETYDTGNVYKGEWKDNEKNGHGVLTLASGDVYEGGFVDGFMQGRGVLSYSHGDVYSGDYYRSANHGRGILTFANGDVYDGEYYNQYMHGRGVFTYANGEVYDGEYEHNNMHGQGVFKYSNGSVYTGEFFNGMRSGTGIFSAGDTDVYERDYLQWPAKSIFNGEWRYGEASGNGTLTFANGEIFEGEWLYGKRDGEGVLRGSDGTTVLQRGVWKDGVLSPAP